MREILQDTFGELLYRPSGCQKMSASLKQSDVLNSGKQVVIFSDSRCIDDIVFSRGSFESSHSVQNKGGDFGDNQYVDGRFTRAYECDHPFCNYVLNKDEARNGLLAGVNSISQDQLVEDGKSLYHLWAFDYTDSSLSSYLNQNKSAAIKKSGYYYLELVDKDSLLYPICKVGNSWTVSDTKSTFATAASVCSSLGGVFTAPNYIVEAEDIRDVINNHTDDRFHINFANINGVWK